MDSNALIPTKVLDISERYRDKYNFTDLTSEMNILYDKYIKRKEIDLLDSLASVIAIDSILDKPSEEFLNMITRPMYDAFVLQFPNVPIESLADMDYESRLEYLNGWTGKLNEIITRDMLNSGYEVGGYTLAEGQSAILADSPTQAGWDLAIINDDGSIVQEIQLKATDSASYIHETLQHYSDIPIITTSEVGNNIDDIRVSASSISNDDLRDSITEAIHTGTNSLIESLIPALPFMIIVMTEAIAVGMGTKSKIQAVKDGEFRIKATTASMAAGGTVAVFMGGVDPVSIAVSLLVRMGLSKYKANSDFEFNINGKIEQLDKLLLQYTRI